MRRFSTVYGVDFSGARTAGRNVWVARLEPAGWTGPPRQLAELWNLGRACGSDERGEALAWLTGAVAASRRALWAFDFPFGLPVEVMPEGAGWGDQLEWVRGWGDDAHALGVECVRRGLAASGRMHVRRLTDAEERATFDSYHYRVIYLFFFGLRDVLGPLSADPTTAVLPFQYARLASARRVVVEACTGSTLKRLGLPHQNYKQPEGGPLTRKRRRTRHAILAGLAAHVVIGDHHRRVIMRNGGGDALDAVVAALGAARSWREADHDAIARHPRYPREGKLFV